MSHVIETLFATTGLALIAESFTRGGRLRPAVSHALWAIVLVRFLMPPLIAWPWALEGESGQAIAIEEPEAPKFQVPPSTAPRERLNVRTPAGATETKAHETVTPTETSFAIETFCLALWGLGTLAMLAWQGKRLRLLAHCLRSTCPAPPWLEAEVASLLPKNARRPRVRVHPHVSMPFIVAWGHSLLVCPSTLLTDENDRRRSVLLHELAHHRRRDHLLAWLHLFATCAWWWNPILWLTIARIEEFAELACDGLVTERMPQQRRAYAAALIDISASASRNTMPVAPTFASRRTAKRSFQRRLILIMQAKNRSPLGWRGRLTALALLAIALPSWHELYAQVPATPLQSDVPATRASEAPDNEVRFEWKETRAASFTKLVADVAVGSIAVLPGSGDQVELAFVARAARNQVKDAETWNARERHATVDEADQQLTIRSVRRPDVPEESNDSSPWQLEVTVRVPAPVVVAARVSTGSVNVRSAQGALTASVDTGSLTVHPKVALAAADLSVTVGTLSLTAPTGCGALKLAVKTGTLTLNMGSASALNARCTTGRMKVDVAQDTDANVTLRTELGEVRVGEGLEVIKRRREMGAEVVLQLGDGRSPYSLEVSKGSIDFTRGAHRAK